MPPPTPSPETMLAVANTWQRQRKPRNTGRWKPFLPLVRKLAADQWTATEITARCLDQGWLQPQDKTAFYRWACRQIHS